MDFSSPKNVMRDKKDGKIVLMDPFFDTLETARFLLSKDGEYKISLFSHFEEEKLQKQNQVNSKLDEIYELKGVKEGNLRRDNVILVEHDPEDQDMHEIIFVRDIENQEINGEVKSPHINFKEESKTFLDKGGCKECENYFKKFKHFELVFDGRTGDTKKVNWQKSLDEFEKSIRDSRIFSDFEFQRSETKFL